MPPDWFRKRARLFHPVTGVKPKPIGSKPKTNQDSLARVSRALRKLHVFDKSFDWFTVLPVFFVIG